MIFEVGKLYIYKYVRDCIYKVIYKILDIELFVLEVNNFYNNIKTYFVGGFVDNYIEIKEPRKLKYWVFEWVTGFNKDQIMMVYEDNYAAHKKYLKDTTQFKLIGEGEWVEKLP